MDQQQENPILQPEAPETVEAPEALQQVTVCDVRFRHGCKTYFFDPDGLALNEGDHIIIDTARGAEFGFCVGANHEVPPEQVVAPLRKVLRLATAQDEKINRENEEKEKRAFTVCQQKISEHKLDMQLVSAEYAFDGSKILFFFTADERVDFRELVKHLASIFHTRIELRQIGVRDKAKMVGGLGICGRPFCCKQFLDDFQPVSIKMAKTQNLSLNPSKISGTCGRLMCCLKYEQDAYESLIKTSPKPESFVDTPDGRGTVIDMNLLRQTVRVRMEERPDEVGCFHNCDICVLRNGKGKKTDPPIPADLAPISGAGAEMRERHPLESPKQDEGPLLDSIIIKSMPEDIPAVEAEPEKIERPKQRPRPAKPRTEQPLQEKKPRPMKPRPAKPDAPNAEGRPAGKPMPRKPRPNRPDALKSEAKTDAPQNAAPRGEGKAPSRRPPYRNRRRPNGGKPNKGGESAE